MAAVATIALGDHEAVYGPAEVNGHPVLIRSQSLPLLLDFIARSSAPQIEAGIRRELELSEPTGNLVREMTVPLPIYRTAADLAALRLGDDFLGLHAAREAPRGSFGILEFAARSAPDVGQALARAVRYLRLLSETVRIELQRADHEVSITHRIPGEPLCLGRHGNEFTLAIMLRYLREMTQVNLPVLRVEFAHGAPAGSLSELEEFFGTTDLHFGTGKNRLILEARTLSLPIPSSDAGLLPWLDVYADSLLPPDGRPARRAHQPVVGLHQQIQTCLSEGTSPTLAELSRRLRVSSRTLQRRLAEANTSYHACLEEVRHELSLSYLADPKLSIYEIALRLGYANERGFERAFMRWRGTTPRGYRRAQAKLEAKTEAS